VSESSSKRKQLSRSELNRLRLAFSSLREFQDGYVHIERFAHFGDPTHALLRFFHEALTAKLDGFYENRTDGLLAVLRLVNCPLTKEIEAALDTPVGSSTFALLQRDYRDKNIAHPQFRMDHQREYVERTESHLATDDDVATFRQADRELQECTAAAYVWLEQKYPQLRADADATDDAVDESP
jgi:hypothetical protein